jgi:hypothetical protein
MNMRNILIIIAVISLLSLVAGTALAHRTEEFPPPPAKFHMLGLSGICADQQYLYVMAGGKIMEYGITDLKLLKSMDLPEPVPPSSGAAKAREPGPCPPFPPPMAAPHGLWAGDHVLYVLAGHVIYRYSTPDLKLQATVELPKPEFHEGGK